MGKGHAARIEWNHGLTVGHAEIDRQHREMVELFNTLHAAVYAGQAGEAQDRMLDRLLLLAKENFASEESLMSAHAEEQERFGVHRAIHRGMLQEMQMLRDGLFQRGGHVNAKTLNFISKWLFEHLTHSDRELADLVRCARGAGICTGDCRSRADRLPDSENRESAAPKRGAEL